VVIDVIEGSSVGFKDDVFGIAEGALEVEEGTSRFRNGDGVGLGKRVEGAGGGIGELDRGGLGLEVEVGTGHGVNEREEGRLDGSLTGKE
jgi:hypothetical protein